MFGKEESCASLITALLQPLHSLTLQLFQSGKGFLLGKGSLVLLVHIVCIQWCLLLLCPFTNCIEMSEHPDVVQSYLGLNTTVSAGYSGLEGVWPSQY